MEKCFNFLMELGKLFEIVENNENNKDKKDAIYQVVKMYLEKENIDIRSLSEKFEQNKCKDSWEIDQLLTYINWRESVKR